MPEGIDSNAQYVAGYTAWHNMNRYVKRGAKAIQIMAPIKKKLESNDISKDEAQNQSHDCVIVGFRVVSVFGISQTDGDNTQIPVLVRGLSDQAFDAKTVFEQIKAT